MANEVSADFLEELKWRGLIHDITPGLEEHLKNEKVRGYIGFDPTAPSMTIGNYVQIMLLSFLQRAGHQPVALMGGATGRIGDPSGKDKERELKSYDLLDDNLRNFKKQVRRFLDCSKKSPNPALVINNWDFYKKMNALDFLRDVGKNITVNTMISRESVKRRMETGISFTEFSYQLIQGYDFVVLNRDHGVTLQMGGSDQFGNISTGVEMARKVSGEKVFAVTTPLLTKSDGTKFGKSEAGNIWMSGDLTSPYEFYQFWINCDDADIPKFFRYFSFKSRAEIEALETEHGNNPQVLKRIFAEEITVRIHGKKAFQSVLAVSELLFNPRTKREVLLKMKAVELETVAKEIPSPILDKAELKNGMGVLDFLTQMGITESNSDARRAMKGNSAISINKTKIDSHEHVVQASELLHGKFLLVENGKKNKYMVQVG